MRKKVKRIAVNDLIRDKLSRGSLAIVSYDGRYDTSRGRRVAHQGARSNAASCCSTSPGRAGRGRSVQGDYVVPDDLMW